MKRTVIRTLLLCCLIALPGAVRAAGASQSGYYFRADAGYAVPAMDAVNEEIAARAAGLSAQTSNLTWDDFAGNGQYATELGYWFNPAFSAGVGMGYQQATVNHSAADAGTVGGVPATITLGERITTRLFTAVVTPTAWLPAVPGLHLGGQFGLGWGAFSRNQDLVVQDQNGSFASLHTDEEYTQASFIAGVFLGYDHALTPASAVSLRVYHLTAKFEDMQGTLSVSQEGSGGSVSSATTSGRLEDSAGNPMPVDFGGLGVTFGVVFRLPSGH